MTIATTHPSGGDLVPAGMDDFGDLGMEDIGLAELSVPRLEIMHDDARFRNRNTKEEFERLNAVILGVVRQRIMWDKEVDDGDKPQCRSTDYQLGWPQPRTDIPESKQFPWRNSNFNAADFEPRPENGMIALPCESCIFKDWGTEHGKTPRCSEQFTFPLMYEVNPGSGEWEPALLTFQRSAAKACKTYISGFKSAKKPMFTSYTDLSLTLQSRGKVDYSTPNFRKGGPTNHSEWDSYAQFYRQIREFLRQAPRGEDPEEGETKAAKPMASAKAATTLDEKDPWATSAAPAAPVDDLPF